MKKYLLGIGGIVLSIGLLLMLFVGSDEYVRNPFSANDNEVRSIELGDETGRLPGVSEESSSGVSGPTNEAKHDGVTSLSAGI